MPPHSTAAVLHAFSTNIDEHVGGIKRQVDRSLEDGETRKLAVKIVSGVYDSAVDPHTGRTVPVVDAWGRQFLAPPGDVCRSRDDQCEIERVWDFMVLNFRYVYDPTHIDTFATLKESLLSGGGDCDDADVSFAALLGSIGFTVIGRVISVPPNPDEWVHTYPLVGIPKDNPTGFVPLDITVEGVQPGWEYPRIARARDYALVG